jgi:spore coat polysaccharide biosynthesis protein SpsF
MDSHRLPGKGLLEIQGRPLLDYVVDRLKLVPDIGPQIIATTDRPVDDPLVEYANKRGLPCFRGDVDNVAKRVLDCADEFDLDAFLRVNGDSPMIAPELLALGRVEFVTGKFDLVTNVLERTYPYGLSVEVVRLEAMRDACSRMYSSNHHEHVTSFFYDNLDQYLIYNILSHEPSYQGVQLAVDTAVDLDRFEWILSELGEAWPRVEIGKLVKLANKFDAVEVGKSSESLR